MSGARWSLDELRCLYGGMWCWSMVWCGVALLWSSVSHKQLLHSHNDKAYFLYYMYPLFTWSLLWSVCWSFRRRQLIWCNSSVILDDLIASVRYGGLLSSLCLSIRMTHQGSFTLQTETLPDTSVYFRQHFLHIICPQSLFAQAVHRSSSNRLNMITTTTLIMIMTMIMIMTTHYWYWYMSMSRSLVLLRSILRLISMLSDVDIDIAIYYLLPYDQYVRQTSVAYNT